MLKLLISLLFLATVLNASDKTMFVGIGAGPVYGINEASNKERSPGFDIKANAVYTNLLGDYVALELGLAYARESHDKTIPSWFESNMLLSDLRARFYFLSFLQWNVSPYLYGGLGVISYSSTYDPSAPAVPETTKPDFVGNNISGTDLMYNFGGGISYTINKYWAIDIAAGQNFTFNDNINPWIDGVDDAFWTAYLTISYNVGDLIKLNGDSY